MLDEESTRTINGPTTALPVTGFVYGERFKRNAKLRSRVALTSPASVIDLGEPTFQQTFESLVLLMRDENGVKYCPQFFHRNCDSVYVTTAARCTVHWTDNSHILQS